MKGYKPNDFVCKEVLVNSTTRTLELGQVSKEEICNCKGKCKKTNKTLD